MKKLTLTIGILIVTSTLSYSQYGLFTPSGGTSSSTTNNIGIGTSSPKSPLMIVPGGVLTETIGNQSFYLVILV